MKTDALHPLELAELAVNLEAAEISAAALLRDSDGMNKILDASLKQILSTLRLLRSKRIEFEQIVKIPVSMFFFKINITVTLRVWFDLGKNQFGVKVYRVTL